MCSQFVTWEDSGRLSDVRDRKTKIDQTKRETRKQGTFCVLWKKKALVEWGKKIRKTYKWRVCNYREKQTQRWVVKYLPAVGSVMGAVFSFHGPNHHTLAPQAPKPLNQQNIAPLLPDSWCKHPPKSNVIRLSRCARRKSASMLSEHEISWRFRPLECQVVQLCRVLLFCVRDTLLHRLNSTLLYRRWRKQDSLKRLWLSTKQHGVTSQKTVKRVLTWEP